MNHPQSSMTTAPASPLRDELSQLCLPSARQDPDRLLAWANSVCLVFLLIGVFGARRGRVDIPSVPPLDEPVPVVTEPTVVAPQENPEPKPADQSHEPEPAAVTVVLPTIPGISFAVPTVGKLVSESALEAAPPTEPVKHYAEVLSLNNTGAGGDRPEPPYPPLAREEAQQGTVVLRMTADAAGNVLTAEVKHSSGYPILDHSTVDFVKRHWRLPADGKPGQSFETTFNYQLIMNDR